VTAILRALLLFCVLGWGGMAAAHTRSESHSAWTIDGNRVDMTFTVPDLEAARLAHGGRPSDRQLLAYLVPRLGVMVGKTRCPLIDRHMLIAATGFRRAELVFRCPRANDMRLISTAFIDLVSTHVNFAQIQNAKGDFVEELLSADHTEVALDKANGDLAGAGFLSFVRMGIMHIFTGVDHMSFLLGLVLISRRLRDLAFVVTGFTLGHSLTLALAVTGVIRPHAEYIDALVALTIALIGIENVVVATRRPVMLALATGCALLAMTVLRLNGYGTLPPLLLLGAGIFSANYLMVSGQLKDAGRLRIVVTLVFGLIHGFGFASDLLESRLPKARMAELLVGFNVGVEIGQLTLVLIVAGLVALLVRMKRALPRPIVTDVTAAGLVGIGTYWFIGRSF